MLKIFLTQEIKLLLLWLFIGLLAGFIYSVELLGVDSSTTLLVASRMRSLHISQMLYGAIPLALSLLPFVLFEQDGVMNQKAISNLKKYFTTWNIFLLFMSMTILFGNMRGLPFYDFSYWLNFILAFSGLFYFMAILNSIKNYKKRPLWVNVSLVVVAVAPLILIFLMNPSYGQVEHTLVGPHGDNTLGMSFAIIPLYYLLIKMFAGKNFIPRGHIFWIIPLVGYLTSLIIRNFFHTLSYNEEWFFQYLTLLYLPLLYIWIKDSNINFSISPFLIISIISFVFVDVEGNILFIPGIRTLIHRNDLVIAHAHIAMGLGVAFMSLSILQYILPKLFTKKIAYIWSAAILLIAGILSIAGMAEAKGLPIDIRYFWLGRAISGLLLIFLTAYLLFKSLDIKIDSRIKLYHFAGFLSDAMGGIILIIFGKLIFNILGFNFIGNYEYVVFAFMIGTGIIHYFGLYGNSEILANISAFIRILVSSMFISLFMAHLIDTLAIMVSIYDLIFASFYWLYLRNDT